MGSVESLLVADCGGGRSVAQANEPVGQFLTGAGMAQAI
jgi:hypothetical protein